MDDIVRQIEALANDRARLHSCAVALQILKWGEARSVLVFSFDHHLFDASGAERFIPQPVQYRALDAATVVVTQGLGADNRVVVQGAPLIAQIR